MTPSRRVLSMLGRWHQWRRAYSVERGFARPSYAYADHDEDELERLTMRTIDAEIAVLPRDWQLALQHVARAECMGVEVLFSPRLADDVKRRNAIEHALSMIEKRLLQAGVI